MAGEAALVAAGLVIAAAGLIAEVAGLVLVTAGLVLAGDVVLFAAGVVVWAEQRLAPPKKNRATSPTVSCRRLATVLIFIGLSLLVWLEITPHA
jgi:hypothetical protein